VLDPFVTAAGFGVVAPIVAGPVLAQGIDRLPQQWRRGAEWSIVLTALALALMAEAIFRGPAAWLFVYVLAALPALITYLVSRTLLASTFMSLLPMYFVIGELTRSWPAHAPATMLDRVMPLEPGWTLVYGSLYVCGFILPLFVVRGRDLFRRALKAYIFVMMVSYAGFLVYPTVAPRPEELAVTGFSTWLLQLLYSLDPPHGCFPSLHVAYSFVGAAACFRMHRRVGFAAAMWAALIALSTVYTRQHYAIDAVAGGLLAWAAYLLFLRGHPRRHVDEHDRRRAPRAAWLAAAVYAVMVAGFWAAYQLGAAAPG
jgi:membrane-associated phospholipid phosphatase